MSDCYVLATERSARLATSFVSHFVPSHTATWNPDDPREVLGLKSGASLAEIFGFLQDNPEKEYTVYLRNTREGSPYYAILAFCADGSLILGLSGDEDQTAATALLGQLEEFSGGKGYWSIEEPPEVSSASFLERRSLE
jgi:hypothetical protein